MRKKIFRIVSAILGLGFITFGIYSFSFTMNSLSEYSTPFVFLMFGYFLLEFAITGRSRLNRILKK